MNERIKELAEQAMVFSHNNGGWRISTHVPNDFKEKFAELIVRECGTVLDNNYPPDELVPIEEVMACLKEHFGVKE